MSVSAGTIAKKAVKRYGLLKQGTTTKAGDDLSLLSTNGEEEGRLKDATNYPAAHTFTNTDTILSFADSCTDRITEPDHSKARKGP